MVEDYLEYREPAAIGVSFRRSGKVYYFSPNGLRLRQGDQVVAETDKGLDIGEVVFIKYDLPESDESKALKPLLRKATEEDLAREQELQQKEREARRLCEEKIAAHNLPMRLIAADYTFDGQRLVFFFSAETRVDFRALVRDLAETFRMRIELRQVGVRDQAKMVGGLGPCGRPLCCNAFLRNFDPVGIRVAKDQGLSLNPAKISGICDRLMCCLRFEHQTYCELAKKLPKAGTTVMTHRGEAVVKNVNLMHERVQVQYPNEEVADLKASQVWLPGEEAPEPEPLSEAEQEQAAEAHRMPRLLPDTNRIKSRPPKRESPPRRERRPENARPERPEPAAPAAEPAAAGEAAEGAGTSRRRRRRRSDRKKKEQAAASGPAAAAGGAQAAAPAHPALSPTTAAPAAGGEGAAEGEGASKRKRRRPRFRPRKKTNPTPGQE